jgi:hypothetical protein
MGIPLLTGRAFNDNDTRKLQGSDYQRQFCETILSKRKPSRQKDKCNNGAEAFREIVGVVGDVKQKGLNRETLPHTYEPFAQAQSVHDDGCAHFGRSNSVVPRFAAGISAGYRSLCRASAR